MLNVLSSLNKAQYEAATTVDKHSMVLSCPGSGKTKTVEAKVVNLLNSIPQSKICCTTFSKSGANEIRERARAAAKGISSLDARLTVSTFHALCYQTIKQYKKTSPNMINEGERKFHIRGAAIDLKIDIKSDFFQKASSVIDNYATMQENQLNSIPKLIHTMRARYKERIHNLKKLDYEDLLVDAIDLLESGRVKPERYTHIICDEAQDSDILMYRWLMIYAKSGSIITLMLDDDQTLYSFRNSLGVDVCTRLEKDLNAVKILNGTNYRSKDEVLAPARKLISKNFKRIKKDIVAHRGTGGSFNTHHLYSQKQTKTLLNTLMAEKPNDWFIICRTNADIKQIADYLIELGINFIGPDSYSILEKPEIQAYIELINTLHNKGGHGLDMVATQCIAPEKVFAELCAKKECSTLLEALDKGLTSQDLSSFNQSQKMKIIDLANRIQSWRQAVDQKRTNRVIRLSGEWMENNYPDDEVPSSIQAITNILLNKTSGEVPNRLIKLQRLLTKNREEKDNAVTLMTGHSSKGLQKKNVLIWNCKNGSFPASLSEDDDVSELDHDEEERRVLYVSMTRAEDNLHIVYQANKINAKRSTQHQPSKYLKEIGIELGIPVGAPKLKSN